MKKTTNGAIIIDSLNNILLVHPTGQPQDSWSIPKGLGDEGELSSESAIRETWEETNLDLDLFKLVTTEAYLGEVNYKNKSKKLKAHLFKIDLELSSMKLNLWCKSMFTDEKTDVKLPECDKVVWVTIDFAKEYLHDTQKIMLEKALKLIK